MHMDFCGSPERKRPSEIPTGKWACSMNMDFKKTLNGVVEHRIVTTGRLL